MEYIPYLGNKNSSKYQAYKDKRNEVKRAVLKAKQKAWEEFEKLMERNSNKNKKMSYRVIKTFRNKPEHRLKITTDKAKNGKVLAEEEKIVSRWKEYFEKLLNTEQKEAPRTNKDIKPVLAKENINKEK